MDIIVICWLAIGTILALVELVTFSFITIWFSIGAFITMFVALWTDNPFILFAVFVISSTLLLLITKPIVKKYIIKNKIPTNADRLIGEVGVVLDQIDNIKGTGLVKIKGMDWRTRSVDGAVIEEGERVTVKSIEGVTLNVVKFEE